MGALRAQALEHFLHVVTASCVARVVSLYMKAFFAGKVAPGLQDRVGKKMKHDAFLVHQYFPEVHAEIIYDMQEIITADFIMIPLLLVRYICKYRSFITAKEIATLLGFHQLSEQGNFIKDLANLTDMVLERERTKTEEQRVIGFSDLTLDAFFWITKKFWWTNNESFLVGNDILLRNMLPPALDDGRATETRDENAQCVAN